MKKKNRSGQSTVEFALVLPLLLLVLYGIIQFGMVFNAQVTLANAAREGARYGAIRTVSDADIMTRTKNAASHAVLVTKDDVQVMVSSRASTVDEFTVRVSYPYVTGLEPVLSGIAKLINPNAEAITSIQLSASATMYLE